MGYLNGKADDREQYIEAWTNHIKELRSMLGQANIPVKEWEEYLQPLLNIVHRAADVAFPEEEQTDEGFANYLEEMAESYDDPDSETAKDLREAARRLKRGKDS